MAAWTRSRMQLPFVCAGARERHYIAKTFAVKTDPQLTVGRCPKVDSTLT